MELPEGVSPHCDSLVLHAPGSCSVCDLYPGRQLQRVRSGVNFTNGEQVPGNEPCPSTRRRSVEAIERWPGNRPQEG